MLNNPVSLSKIITAAYNGEVRSQIKYFLSVSVDACHKNLTNVLTRATRVRVNNVVGRDRAIQLCNFIFHIFLIKDNNVGLTNQESIGQSNRTPRLGLRFMLSSIRRILLFGRPNTRLLNYVITMLNYCYELLLRSKWEQYNTNELVLIRYVHGMRYPIWYDDINKYACLYLWRRYMEKYFLSELPPHFLQDFNHLREDNFANGSSFIINDVPFSSRADMIRLSGSGKRT